MNLLICLSVRHFNSMTCNLQRDVYKKALEKSMETKEFTAEYSSNTYRFVY